VTGRASNTLPVHFQAWSASLNKFGASLSEEWFYQNCGTSALEMIELLNKQFCYQLDLSSVNAERKKTYQSMIHAVKEIQEVAEIARANYGQVPMAVASGGDGAIVQATLEVLKLHQLFNTVVSVDDVSRGKPEPDIFLLAAKRLGVAPEDCIVYEDSDSGLEAARRAGMRFVDVRAFG
jgi:HAD superfamily hydrolase (TIGR01549 family)